jgi:hypothetical protein
MTDREKDASIELILNNGLVKPQTVYRRVREILSSFGLRYIFWDMSYSVCFSAFVLVMLFFALFIVPEKFSHSAAVGFAPALFLLMTFFAETSERTEALYELKQTCRYTIRQITAFRAMCYSAAGIVFTASVAAITANTPHEFITLLPLCLSMLFLCAVIQLSVLRFVRHKWAVAVISAAWVLISVIIPVAFGEQWESLLRNVPVAIGITLAVTSMAALAIQIKTMLMEVKRYAVA